MSARQDIADALAGVLPDNVTVYAYPPNALAAPCVIVKLRGAEQIGPCLWSQEYRVTVVAPGGDNEAALDFLETWLIQIADLLSTEYAQPIGWEEPGIAISGAASYLASVIDLTVEIKIPALV